MEINQEEMKAMLDTCLEKMKTNPGELQSVAVHQKVPNEEVTVETIRALEEQYGDWHLARAPLTAKETDPGQWWILEEVGHCLQINDPLCHSCTVQGTWSSEIRQG
jgi:hypothetical protein